jgi:hypothetical protein
MVIGEKQRRVGVRGFPPIRLKKGEWMGHRLLECSAVAHKKQEW